MAICPGLSVAVETLVVATWGAPFEWRDSRYRVEVADRNCRPVDFRYSGVLKSRSTLKPVLDAYEGELAVIYVADTLAYHKRFPGKQGLEAPSYEDLKRAVEEEVAKFVEGQLRLSRGSFQVKVAPGVGSFGEAEFPGSVANFQVYVATTLYLDLLEYGPRTVILDLSHGVNYMPVVARLAVEDSLNAYLLTPEVGVDEVRLVTVNSEPVVGGGEEDAYTIHTVECLNLTRDWAVERARHMFEAVTGRYLKPYKMLERRRPPQELDNLSEDIKESFREAEKLLGSIVYGMPLYLAHRASEAKRGLRKPEEIATEVQRLLERRKARKGDGRLVYGHEYSLDPGVIAASLSLSALTHSLVSHAEKGGCRERQGLLGGCNIRFFSLETLKSLVELSKPYLSAYRIAQHELSRIELSVKTLLDSRGDLIRRGPIIVGLELLEKAMLGETPNLRDTVEAIEGFGREKGKDPCQPEEPCGRGLQDRIMFAHAGLQREAVLVLIGEKEACLAYRPGVIREIERIIDS